MGIPWHRVTAHDPATVDQEPLRQELADQHHEVIIGPGSQCCALTNFDIYRRILAEDFPAARILQDDVQVSPDIQPFLETLDWLPQDLHLVQFEKYGKESSLRLVGPAVGKMPVAGRSLHQLHSRTAGAACYLITHEGASRILRGKPVLHMPIDHFLFSPNLSPLFDQLGVAVLRPALARQLTNKESRSDLQMERMQSTKRRRNRVRRLFFEIKRTPMQLYATVGGARWLDYTYKL